MAYTLAKFRRVYQKSYAKVNSKMGVLIANFGGPRHLEEVFPFLKALLCDQDMLRTPFPPFLHRWLFTRVARKRREKLTHDYTSIGGKSPIFEDTEFLATQLRKELGCPVLTFHRYLTETHASFVKTLESFPEREWIVFPCFPQFSYATTGSIARWFSVHLKSDTLRRLRWIRSYASHRAYLRCFERVLRDYLQEHGLIEDSVCLFFSAHGLPQTFIKTGDPYASECQASFAEIAKAFPKARALLAYQSKFGKGEWLRPYTDEMCRCPKQWMGGAAHVVFVPLSFTSDHIETLYEVETQYLPALRAQGISAHRAPALNRREEWLQAIAQIIQEGERCSNDSLIFLGDRSFPYGE